MCLCYIYLYIFIFVSVNNNDDKLAFSNRESDISKKIIEETQSGGYWNPKDAEKEILSKYEKLSRKDNVVIPAIDSNKERMVWLFKIKRHVTKTILFLIIIIL